MFWRPLGSSTAKNNREHSFIIRLWFFESSTELQTVLIKYWFVIDRSLLVLTCSCCHCKHVIWGEIWMITCIVWSVTCFNKITNRHDFSENGENKINKTCPYLEHYCLRFNADGPEGGSRTTLRSNRKEKVRVLFWNPRHRRKTSFILKSLSQWKWRVAARRCSRSWNRLKHQKPLKPDFNPS